MILITPSGESLDREDSTVLTHNTVQEAVDFWMREGYGRPNQGFDVYEIPERPTRRVMVTTGIVDVAPLVVVG